MHNIISYKNIYMTDSVYNKIKNEKANFDVFKSLYDIAKEKCHDINNLCVCYKNSLIINLRFNKEYNNLFIDDFDILQVGETSNQGCVDTYDAF